MCAETIQIMTSNVMGIVVMFIGVVILISITPLIIGNVAGGTNCSQLDGYDKSGVTHTGWAKICADSGKTDQTNTNEEGNKEHYHSGQLHSHYYTDENGNDVVKWWHENGQLSYHQYIDENGNKVEKGWDENGKLRYHYYTDENGDVVEHDLLS